MYKKLIQASETLLPLFPWPKEHNDDQFQASQLDIPNYDTIWNCDRNKQNKEDLSQDTPITLKIQNFNDGTASDDFILVRDQCQQLDCEV